MFSTDEQKARLQKREMLVAHGDGYAHASNRTHDISAFLVDFDSLSAQKSFIVLAGRVTAVRTHGGSTFVTLKDASGSGQLFLSKKDVGNASYAQFTSLVDAADFIEISGTAFLTKKGEKTLFVRSWRMLTKALLPLPEKWHGLTDVETRFRKRYLDFLMNPETIERILTRTKIISAMRAFFDGRDFVEVETPTLQPLYGGGFARPFKTHHHALDADFYLRISDELYLKRMLVGGFERVYEITKVFRNEGIDHDHNPEFTMCEAQVAYKDYEWGMDFFEELVEYVAGKAVGSTLVRFGDTELSFTRPWKRMTMVDALKKIAHIDVTSWKSITQAKKELSVRIKKEKKHELERLSSVGECIAFAFEELVEEQLIQPTLIYDYPVEVSPLAKKCAHNPSYAARFEVFVLGMEIGNNYSELNDPVDLEARFIEEKKKENAGFDEAHQSDTDFLTAIAHGMPPACGIGIGIDRLVMVLTGSTSIKEIICFPTLRPHSHEN